MKHLIRIIPSLLLGFIVGLPAVTNAGDRYSDVVEWVPWQGRLPRNAIRGGIDQDGRVPLYICRAHHINGIHPGKLLSGKCNIGWGGGEVVLHHFEVLVSTERYYRHRDRDRYYDDDRRR